MVFKLTRQIGLLKMNLLSYAQNFSGRAIFFRIATLACYMGFWASGPWIDQLLGFYQGAVGDGPQGEEEVVGHKGADVLLAHQGVLLVKARLLASGQPGDFVQFRVVHSMIEGCKLSGENVFSSDQSLL